VGAGKHGRAQRVARPLQPSRVVGPSRGRGCDTDLDMVRALGGRSFAAPLGFARRGGRHQGREEQFQVTYYWAPGDEAFYMLYAYAKSEQGDLTAAQTRALTQLVRGEFK
jgi:hypothetical protein